MLCSGVGREAHLPALSGRLNTQMLPSREGMLLHKCAVLHVRGTKECRTREACAKRYAAVLVWEKNID